MPNPSLQVKINGVDLTQYTEQDNWSVTQQWGRQGATAKFVLYDEFATPSARHFTPQALQPIIFTDLSAGVVLFEGLITNPTWKYVSPNACEWYVDCKDFTYYADQFVVNGDFTYQNTDTIIVQLTQQANIGIVAKKAVNGGFVQPGIVVPRFRLNYKPLSTAWTQLAALASGATATATASSAANQFGWFVDANLNLHFYNASQQAADPAIASGVLFTDILVSGDSGGGTTFRGFIDWNSTPQYEFDGANLRNSCIVRGANVQNKQTDRFVGNGSQTSWPFTFALLTTNPHFSLTGNGVKLSIDTTAQAASRQAKPLFLAQQAQNGQWFMTVNTGAPGAFVPAAGVVLALTYNYEAPVVARVDDVASQQAIRNQLIKAGIPNSSGIFQHYIADKTIKDHGTAQQRAQREIQEYSKTQERITFETSDDWPGTINAGQIFSVTSQYIPNSQNGYASGLTAVQFLAQKVEIKPSAKKANFRVFSIMAIRIS